MGSGGCGGLGGQGSGGLSTVLLPGSGMQEGLGSGWGNPGCSGQCLLSSSVPWRSLVWDVPNCT